MLLVMTVLTLIAASFIPYRDAAEPGQLYKPEITNGIICMTYFLIGAVRSMIRAKSSRPLKAALKEIDYYTILLLAGLVTVPEDQYESADLDGASG